MGSTRRSDHEAIPWAPAFPMEAPAPAWRNIGSRTCEILGAFPDQIIEETEEDLQGFVDVGNRGVTVRRPDTWPHEQTMRCSGKPGLLQLHPGCVAGDRRYVIGPQRDSRALAGTGSYRRLLMEYYDSGAKWFSAPKPLLEDRLFEFDRYARTEPAFDAANILRLGALAVSGECNGQ